MQRARRHQRISSGLAFALLALIAELTGRSLTHRLDVGRHVGSRYSGAEYYPFLLAAVKLGVALLLARLVWRFIRAQRAARAGRRVLATVGKARGAAAAPAARPLAAALDARLPDDLDLLPPADRRRAGRLRALAAARAVAAQLGAARLRRARRARRARLERGRLLAARVRALRRGHLRPRRQDRPPGRAAACRARAHELPPRRENCSASPSSAGRRPSPRSPRTTPRARGTLSSRPGEVE